MEIHALQPANLVRFIERIRKSDVEAYEGYFHSLLLSALSDLGEFVPSAGGIVLIDDPSKKEPNRVEKDLTYVAGYGVGFPQVLGKRLLASSGIVAETYVLGKSTVRKVEPKERMVLDRVTYPHQLNSIIAVPLKVENANIGALILHNKKDPVGFTIRDLKLVEIFAGYIATSLQNAIDARKSQELSKRDDLTGLFNDRYFHRQLEIEIHQAEEKRHPLCLLFLDLDNFKSINDQYGHLVGSQTLKEIGFIIREAVGDKKATIARYGGDEYVLILPGIDIQGAEEISELIRKMIIGKLFMIDRGENDGSFINFKGVLSCSIGIASFHEHLPTGGTVRERKNHFLRLADQAMYLAKERGKNQYCISEGMK